MAKKGPKMVVFWPPRAKFFENQKKGSDMLLLLPQRGCIPNFRKFGSSDLEKMRYERTDERTDGTEIIGPSGKIPGTKNLIVLGIHTQSKEG